MGVDKREKVINGLECNLNFAEKSYCEQCGYECRKAMFISVPVNLLSDALSLLKEQEPVKPVMHYVPDGKRSNAAWQCGNCLIDIGYGANYCYNCGKAVKWE